MTGHNCTWLGMTGHESSTDKFENLLLMKSEINKWNKRHKCKTKNHTHTRARASARAYTRTHAQICLPARPPACLPTYIYIYIYNIGVRIYRARSVLTKSGVPRVSTSLNIEAYMTKARIFCQVWNPKKITDVY